MARRLSRLGAVELLNAVLLPVVVGLVVPITPALVAAWVAVDALLMVGAAYWFARARRIRGRLDRTPGLRAFAAARVVLLVVLAGTAAAIVGDLAVGGRPASWVGVPVWLFAVAEYVNYFCRQLSYQNRADIRRLVRNRRLLPAPLGVDLARC